ncbi:MAG TPA: hypothetical protein PK867_02430 [Pirellulales bacterium]|nr:hypothetical protein [Pirellulales bacterium]
MSTIYHVLLVQENEGQSGTATLHRSPFASLDAKSAKLFADAFNERELVDPLGLWAIVRPVVRGQLAVVADE